VLGRANAPDAEGSKIRAWRSNSGAQLIGVRGFDELKEKNERLFPTFDPSFARPIYEETDSLLPRPVQSGPAAAQLLDADYTL